LDIGPPAQDFIALALYGLPMTDEDDVGISGFWLHIDSRAADFWNFH
jgi:hypothetical protein